MDEEEAQMVRLHVKGLGANLSELVERNKAIERENRSLRARVSELEAVQVVATTPLREHVSTQTDPSLIHDSPPGSSRHSPTTPTSSNPPSPPPLATRPNPPVSKPSPVPVQEPSVAVFVQPALPHQVEVAVVPVLQTSIPEEGNTTEMSTFSDQHPQLINEGRVSENNITTYPIECLHPPVGLAEALHMNPDPATAAAMGSVGLAYPEEEGEHSDEGNTNNHAVSRPGILPSLWHILARRGRLPSRQSLCTHIVRSTPAAPSDGGRGLGFLLGEVVVRDPA